jgi:hypothetical protein
VARGAKGDGGTGGEVNGWAIASTKDIPTKGSVKSIVSVRLCVSIGVIQTRKVLPEGLLSEVRAKRGLSWVRKVCCIHMVS